MDNSSEHRCAGISARQKFQMSKRFISYKYRKNNTGTKGKSNQNLNALKSLSMMSMLNSQGQKKKEELGGVFVLNYFIVLLFTHNRFKNKILLFSFLKWLLYWYNS